MIPFEPLWAADLGWIIPVIFVIIMIITAIGNVIAKINEQQAKAQRRPGDVRRPRPQQPRPRVGVGGGGRGGIQEEITEFLRRAAGGQAVPQQPQAPPPRPARRPLAAERPIEAEVVADDPGRRAVGAGIDTSTFDQRTSQLGGDVVQADRQFDERLEGRFEHEVSALAQTRGSAEPATPRRAASTSGAEVPPTAAAGFAAMLSNADNIRQAIVLSEILNRPLDRWQ